MADINTAALPDVENEAATREHQIKNIAELMQNGDIAEKKMDYESAIEFFSQAYELAAQVYGSDTAEECLEPVFRYGSALAEYSILENELNEANLCSLSTVVKGLKEKREGQLAPVGSTADDSRIGDPDALNDAERAEVIQNVEDALIENAKELESGVLSKADEHEMDVEPVVKTDGPKDDVNQVDATEDAKGTAEEPTETQESKVDAEQQENADNLKDSTAHQPDSDVKEDVTQDDEDLEGSMHTAIEPTLDESKVEVTTTVESTNVADKEETNEKIEDDKMDTSEQPATESIPVAVDSDGDAEEEQEDDEEENVDNHQLGWEILEVARTIAERHVGEAEWDKKRARIHWKIGQLCNVSSFPLAIEEFEKTIAILQKYRSVKDDRFFASVIMELGTAYKNNNNFAESARCYQRSLDILKEHCGALKQMVENPDDDSVVQTLKDELEVVNDLIASTEGLIEDAKGSQASHELAQAEKAAEASKNESPSKMSDSENHVPVSDLTANVRKGKRPANESEEAEVKKPKVADEGEVTETKVEC